MIKKTVSVFAFIIGGLIFGVPAQAEEGITISGLANGNTTQSYFQKMVGMHHLPGWIKNGGTESPNREVVISSKKYLVLTSCKPHDCASEMVAVLFSPETRKMSAVFSKYDATNDSQSLVWLNVPDDLSIDGKTVLFAALSGSLENHPQNFNYH